MVTGVEIALAVIPVLLRQIEQYLTSMKVLKNRSDHLNWKLKDFKSKIPLMKPATVEYAETILRKFKYCLELIDATEKGWKASVRRFYRSRKYLPQLEQISRDMDDVIRSVIWEQTNREVPRVARRDFTEEAGIADLHNDSGAVALELEPVTDPEAAPLQSLFATSTPEEIHDGITEEEPAVIDAFKVVINDDVEEDGAVEESGFEATNLPVAKLVGEGEDHDPPKKVYILEGSVTKEPSIEKRFSGVKSVFKVTFVFLPDMVEHKFSYSFSWRKQDCVKVDGIVQVAQKSSKTQGYFAEFLLEGRCIRVERTTGNQLSLSVDEVKFEDMKIMTKEQHKKMMLLKALKR